MDRVRNRHLLASDLLLLLASPFFLYALRFEGWSWAPEHVRTALVFAAIAAPLQVVVLQLFGLYRRLWRYASIDELELIFVAGATAGSLAAALGIFGVHSLGLTPVRVPVSVAVTHVLLAVAVIATPRLTMRIAGWRSMRARAGQAATRRVIIAGAGTAGQMILRELRTNPKLAMEPVGFVDDDRTKQGLRVSNVPVLGGLADIGRHARGLRVDAVIIAMPSAPGAVVREVVRAASEAGVATQTMPSLSEIIAGKISVAALRKVEIQDLLRREPVQTDLTQVGALCTGRVVVVTGAGGSIGSELCRQIAALGPARLVLLGHGENSIFDILQELRIQYPTVDFRAVIADVRDRDRIRRVMAQHRPNAVFHAAAHKHVPLMEENAVEAVTNNVGGTRNVVEAAGEAGVEHFVLISTDKAVRPTSIMGATKRVAEYVVHEAAQRYGRNYVAVRFGNVLGSRGSVVPTFVRQIRAGGPVTVTHPDMRRFFMTIPEAVQLVLQAGALGEGGELFMLDMGEPVKIVDLARDLIRLSGLEEGTDIEIRFTGMRPGEKLYEEMFFSHEVAAPTEHPKILRARQGQNDCSDASLIEELVELAEGGGAEPELRTLLRCLVPDFEVERGAEPTPVSVPAIGAAKPARPDAGRPAARTTGSKPAVHVA